jgi:glycosyltransferase involved in cell wall biosynthesis
MVRPYRKTRLLMAKNGLTSSNVAASIPANCRILTDIQERRSNSPWHETTHFDSKIAHNHGFIPVFSAIYRTLKLASRFDAIVLTSNRRGNLAASILGMMPRRKRPVIVMVDCLWYVPKGRVLRAFKRLQFLLLSRAVDVFVVWASHEIDDYSKAFKISATKLRFIPHHHTLEGYSYVVAEGDYLFSGGDGDRDYVSLLTALETLPVSAIIATRIKPTPVDEKNRLVSIKPVTSSEFRSLMAGAKIVVIPMKKGLLHSGGQQTYLNAMALGKPVIVADDKGARDYIEDGVNGLLVPAENPILLRNAIKTVLENEDLRQSLMRGARQTLDQYSTPSCMIKILELTSAMILQRNGRSPNPARSGSS